MRSTIWLPPVPEALSLDRLLRSRAAAAPDVPLMISAEWPEPVSVGAMARMAGAAAAWLAARGIGPGDRIAVWGQNSVPWAVWLCAAAWRGAAVVALHPQLGGGDLKSALDQAKTSWLIVDEMARGRSLADVARAVQPDRLTVMPGGDGALDLAAVIDLDAPVPPLLGDADAPVNLQFTSGSTGRPKIVELSHRALVLNAQATAEAAGIVPGDVMVSPLPFVHAAGLSSGFVLALAVGSTWITGHRFRPDVTLAQIRLHRATVLQGVPTMFKALLDLVEQQGVKTDSLRLGFIGGAPCPPDLCRRAIDVLGLDHIAIVYGQTEFGPTISITTGQEPGDLSLTSVGPAIANTEVRIVDPATLQDATGDGEIWVRGPTLMNGYFENPDANAAAVTADGWLRTGDLGRIVQNCLQVTARLKELIIRGGENVSPYEVEDALRDAPGVADICAVPAPSAHWGEEICAVLLRQPGHEIDLAVLKARAEARLTRFKRPDRYILRDELPLLPSGKVDRRAVRDAVQRGEW